MVRARVRVGLTATARWIKEQRGREARVNAAERVAHEADRRQMAAPCNVTAGSSGRPRNRSIGRGGTSASTSSGRRTDCSRGSHGNSAMSAHEGVDFGRHSGRAGRDAVSGAPFVARHAQHLRAPPNGVEVERLGL